MLVRRGPELRFWHWSGAGWVELAEASQGLEDLLAILPGFAAAGRGHPAARSGRGRFMRIAGCRRGDQPCLSLGSPAA